MHLDLSGVSFHLSQCQTLRVRTERARAVIALPWIPAFEHVSKGARWIQSARQRTEVGIGGMSFDGANQVLIQHVFEDGPSQACCRSDDVIHETLRRIHGLDMA